MKSDGKGSRKKHEETVLKLQVRQDTQGLITRHAPSNPGEMRMALKYRCWSDQFWPIPKQPRFRPVLSPRASRRI